MSVDFTEAPKKILHMTETMPVQPGPLTLVYPKWIPGEHEPTGPIDNMAGFVITANSALLKWERDKLEMYAFHLSVPQGVTQLEMKMDFLATAASTGCSAGASTSANLALLSWNTVVLYPDGANASTVMLKPQLTIPAAWQFGTALETDGEPVSTSMAGLNTLGSTIRFKTVSLEMLIDSPVLAGRYFREVLLAPEVSPKHFLDMASDGPANLELSPEHVAAFSWLVRETGALYKSRHYGSYHFLVTLSDQVAHLGLDHPSQATTVSMKRRLSMRTFLR